METFSTKKKQKLCIPEIWIPEIVFDKIRKKYTFLSNTLKTFVIPQFEYFCSSCFLAIASNAHWN